MLDTGKDILDHLTDSWNTQSLLHFRRAVSNIGFSDRQGFETRHRSSFGKSSFGKIGQELRSPDVASDIVRATSIPTNHWNAAFINRTADNVANYSDYNFTNPAATLDLGDQRQGQNNNGIRLYMDYGLGSPDSSVQSDNFAMQAWTRVHLEASKLYRITTKSDDGTYFLLKNARTNEWRSPIEGADGGDWRDRGSGEPQKTIFFKVNESTDYDFHMQYYERGGGSVIDFNLEEAYPFYNFIDGQESNQWRTTAYFWDTRDGSEPSLNFYENDSNRIGVLSLGSNDRGNGIHGANFDLGLGPLNGDYSLPDTNFAIRAYTHAYFDGGTYKFRCRGDDGFQILAKQWGTGEWTYITPQSSWQYAYGDAQEYTIQLAPGQYDLHFHYFERGGGANFDMAWEKVSNPDIDIQESFSGYFAGRENLVRRAVENWESIITQHSTQNGLVNITFVIDYNYDWDGSYGYAYPNDSVDDNQGTVYLNPALLQTSDGFMVRLIMHEIGHTLGLGNGLNPSDLGDNQWHGDSFGNPYTKGLMSYWASGGSADDNSQMYNEMQYLGFQFSRYGIANNGYLY